MPHNDRKGCVRPQKNCAPASISVIVFLLLKHFYQEMLNTPQVCFHRISRKTQFQGEGKDVLTGCCIELAQEPIYAPGDLLIGKVHVKISRGFLNVNSLRVSLKGVANVAIKGKVCSLSEMRNLANLERGELLRKLCLPQKGLEPD